MLDRIKRILVAICITIGGIIFLTLCVKSPTSFPIFIFWGGVILIGSIFFISSISILIDLWKWALFGEEN